MKLLSLELLAFLAIQRGDAFNFTEAETHPEADDSLSDGPWEEDDNSENRAYPNEQLEMIETPSFQAIDDKHLKVSVKINVRDERGLLACYLAEASQERRLLGTMTEAPRSGIIQITAELDPKKSNKLFFVALYLSTVARHKYSKSVSYNPPSVENGKYFVRQDHVFFNI